MFTYYRCTRCGRKYYPPKKRCVCGSSRFEKVATEKAVGELVTFTTIYVPPQGFKPPIKIGIARVEGMNILGVYAGEEEPRIGMRVIVDNSDGKTIIKPLGDS